MTILSVIIPTRNRADLLQLALQSLKSQTLSADSFEVLVIDNGSTDNTKQIVDSFQKQLGYIRYFFDPTPGLHVGRHLGLKMAKSDILVYADDDIEAFPTWLEGIAESFQDTSVVLVGGKNLPKFEIEPPDWILKMWVKDKNGNRILGYLSIIDLGDAKKEISSYHVFGCNFSIRKSVLLEAGGFHPDTMPQDIIQYRGDGETHVSKFINNMGYRTTYNAKASVFHKVPKERLTEAYFCKRAYLQGISDSYTRIRNAFHEKNSPARQLIQYLHLWRKKWRLYSNARRRRFEHYYYQGYHMHQNASRKDKTIYEWIIRSNYMDF